MNSFANDIVEMLAGVMIEICGKQIQTKQSKNLIRDASRPEVIRGEARLPMKNSAPTRLRLCVLDFPGDS